MKPNVRDRPRTRPRNAYYETRRPVVAYSSGTQRGLYAAKDIPWGVWRDEVLRPLLSKAYAHWNR